MHLALFAGTPTPLPLESAPVQRLSSTVDARLQAVSFFLLAILLCTTIVWALWNYLRRDLTKMPRVSFGRALAGVLLWSLLFFTILTVISGARELATPGAWDKSSFAYQPAPEPREKGVTPSNERYKRMEALRTALWQFAALNHGRFPLENELKEIPDNLWNVPEGAGSRFRYFAGLNAGTTDELLVVEPEFDARRRWVLMVNGEIIFHSTADIQAKQALRGVK